MGEDVRIIRLIRKTIFGEKNLQNSSTQGLNEYFVTDYFDIMRVEKGDVHASFTSMLGILPEETDGVDIAVHGFALYCSEEMMELEKENSRCKDPFQSANKKMPFLSIIQVHITPEIMARMPKGESAERFLDRIYQDLHMAMNEYGESTEHQTEKFIFRIYKMLSVGDFAIVVRSSNEEISFGISSYLRRRVSNSSKIVFYKTYTIFTLGDEVIECNFDEQCNVREDRFVLRCCYSNLYWRSGETVNAYLEQKKLSFEDKPYGLNGRYDFSVRVTRKQFLELLSDIRDYKETGHLDLGEDYVDDECQTAPDDIVKYMRYLMNNSYLSYINERYLVAQGVSENKPVKNNFSIVSIREAAETEEIFLDTKITELYKVVKGHYKQVCSEIKHNVEFRKNIWYYMGLLGKQIDRYYGISGFSDTRIYSIMLLKQIDVILGLINEYTMLYKAAEDESGSEESEKGAMLNRLEDDIRESVCALDNYAQYIRSRNLQSLQTPNYDLESEMSLEKILIGYSEFIKTFMDFYPKWGGMENTVWFPVVVPRLEEKDVSVRRLFPKGNMNDWENEKIIRSTCQKEPDSGIVVISVPIIEKLGNVETMVTSLIHEMAHQFRYEEREERNDALLKYLVHNVMREITYDVIQKIMEETDTIEFYYKFGRTMTKILTDVYLEINYEYQDEKLKYSFREAPLSNFEYCFRKDLYDTFDHWEKKDQIDDAFHDFLKKLMQYYQGEDSRLLEAVEVMDGLIVNVKKNKGLHDKDDKENKENKEKDPYEQIVSCAFGISWMCACKREHLTGCNSWDATAFLKWVKEIEVPSYEELWCKVFPKASLMVSENDIASKIYKNFRDFSIWIYDNCGNEGKAKDYENKQKTVFLKKAYEKLCQEWKGAGIQEELLSDNDSIISLIGRAMGIDCEAKENFKFFERRMTLSIVQNLKLIAERADWRIDKYREETADIFMCNVMGLDPFGYMYQLASEWLSERQLPNEYYSRSQNVLLFQWCTDKEKDKTILSRKLYMKECRKMGDTLEEAIRTVSQKLTDKPQKGKASGLLEKLPEKPIWIEQDELRFLQWLDWFDDLKDYCDKMMDICKDMADKRAYEKLKRYYIITNMLGQLLPAVGEHISYMNEFEEICNDYITGVETLKGLNEEMCQSPIGEKDEKGCTMINRVGKFCREIGRWLNEPCLLLEDDDERKRRNTRSTEFLLEMYYENKKRIAQQVGGEKCT